MDPHLQHQHPPFFYMAKYTLPHLSRGSAIIKQRLHERLHWAPGPARLHLY